MGHVAEQDREAPYCDVFENVAQLELSRIRWGVDLCIAPSAGEVNGERAGEVARKKRK